MVSRHVESWSLIWVETDTGEFTCSWNILDHRQRCPHFFVACQRWTMAFLREIIGSRSSKIQPNLRYDKTMVSLPCISWRMGISLILHGFHMEVSYNRGTPSSHPFQYPSLYPPFWRSLIYGNPGNLDLEIIGRHLPDGHGLAPTTCS